MVNVDVDAEKKDELLKKHREANQQKKARLLVHSQETQSSQDTSVVKGA